jgi:type IV secretory pathway VirB4 component
MLKIKRILRDYGEAGSLNSLVGLWGFVDDETFITKAGHVGVVYRVAGVDYECLDHAQRRDVVHRYEAALRSLDESCRVYQYLIKRRVAPITPAPCAQQVAHEAVQRRAAYLNSRRDELYEFDLHLVLLFDGLRSRGATARRVAELWTQPRSALKTWLSPNATRDLLETDVDRAVAHLHHKATAFEVLLTDSVRPLRLCKDEAFSARTKRSGSSGDY